LGPKENVWETETLEVVKKYLDEKHEPDVTFKVKNMEFPAHKHVLTTRSLYFSKMFSSKIILSESVLIKERWNDGISDKGDCFH